MKQKFTVTVFAGLLLLATASSSAAKVPPGPINRIAFTLNKDIAGVYNNVDGCVAVFDSTFSYSIGQEDGTKFPNTGESISMIVNNMDISINGLPMPKGGDTIVLRLYKMNAIDNYKLKLINNQFRLPQNVQGFLYDSINNTSTLLDPDSNVVMLPAGNPAPNEFRFKVIFKSTIPVPVSFTSVKAVANDNATALQWNTANQENLSHFVIERSTDAIRFTSLASIATNNSCKYSYIDRELANNQQYFYRIKAVDNNGKSLYSQTVTVGITNDNSIEIVNPVQNHQLQIRFTKTTNATQLLQLTDAQGKTVLSRQINVIANTVQFIELPKSLSKAVYTLSVFDANKYKTISHQLVIAN